MPDKSQPDIKNFNQGYTKSRNSKRAVDSTGRPLPWLTYPAIYFLESYLDKKLGASRARILEFGGGQSTKFFLEKNVRQLVTFETSQDFAKELEDFECPGFSGQRKLILCQPSEIVKQLNSIDGIFDIVIIDGRNRNKCLESSLSRLSDEGVIFFDNSDRARYMPSMRLMEGLEFVRLDLYGLSPGLNQPSVTSVFFKQLDALKIPSYPPDFFSQCGCTIGQLESIRKSELESIHP